ncbi:Set1/Ash2 histone methyltransferase complex subunit ASH2 [Pichia californica]|uniref:Set1/Ash2 histone methyltransferase complex subunit ASH2 n=1 Tax=Pichia californica TaxID=460514 RepID=A0A9P6WML7_9ASCO|nr:Set1/Ash2 histone methyltransferase complex subunit ASH2 [[Candida] californica]
MAFNQNEYNKLTETNVNNSNNNNNNIKDNKNSLVSNFNEQTLNNNDHNDSNDNENNENNYNDNDNNDNENDDNDNDETNDENDDNQKLSFLIQRKRSRSTKACILCHNRKVKCDVATKGANGRCTNCLLSGSDCIIYVRKKRSANKKRLTPSILSSSTSSSSSIKNKVTKSKIVKNEHSNSNLNSNSNSNSKINTNSNQSDNSDNDSNDRESQQVKIKPNDVSILSSNMNDLDSFKENIPSSNIPNFSSNFLKPSAQDQYPHLSAIKLDPNVVLKENMYDLMKTEFGINDNTNYFMKEILNSALNKITESYKRTYSLDQIEYKILEDMGCLTLPDEKTCWECIDNFFEFINPQLPIIDKTNFYETYSDLRNPPSLLLLYSVLFVGAWHANSESENPEEQFESVRIAQLFFKRARFLYEYSIECEPIALIQSLFCFSFNNETMSNIAKNDYYWIHIAICVAYEYGFHLKPSKNLPPYKKKMQKRLWWLLYYKDRITAFGYARPSAININDCDQDILTLDDLSNCGMTHLEKVYLLNLIKFSKLLDKIGSIQHEITKLFVSNRPVIHLMKKCDLIMIKFLQNLPKELKFKFNDKSTHSFLALMTLSQYYTLLIVIHRANILRHSADVYPSWAITFQAVQMIKLLSDCLVAKNLIKKVALLSHNTLTTPAIIMLYHLLNEDKKISKIANDFFLRILGIWRATYRKFPVCYPMICIFGYIYNSEEHLKQIVKSVAPNYNDYDADDDDDDNNNNDDADDDNNNIRNNNSRNNNKNSNVDPNNDKKKVDNNNTNDDLETNKTTLKLPDLSFIANSEFKIPSIPDPLNLKSDKNINKFEDLGINFDKLFSESVFANGETLVPKLDLESISQNSKINSSSKNKSNLEKEMKIEVKKEHGDKPEHDNTNIHAVSESPTISVSNASVATQNFSIDYNGLGNNSHNQQGNSFISDNFDGLIFPNALMSYKNLEFHKQQQQHQYNSETPQMAHDNSQIPLPQQHQQQQQQGQEQQLQHHSHQYNHQHNYPYQQSQADVPVSLWMMKTTWKPKFNIGEDGENEDISKGKQYDDQKKRINGEYNDNDLIGKAENFYGDVYQIMGSTFNEVRQDNNSEGGSVVNSNQYSTQWDNNYNEIEKYQLPSFDKFSHVTSSGSDIDTLHKYRYTSKSDGSLTRPMMSVNSQNDIHSSSYTQNTQYSDNSLTYSTDSITANAKPADSTTADAKPTDSTTISDLSSTNATATK